MASGSESRRHRRIQSLQVRYQRLFTARPSRAGPVPHPSDGSQPGSVRCAATSDAANPKGSNPHTTPKSSDPGSCCCAEATRSPPHNKRASTNSSTNTGASKPAGKPSKNSTASTSPRTTTAPLKPSTGSVTSAPPARYPEFHHIVDTIISWSDEILAWHHTGRVSNGRIEETDNLLQVLRRTAHGFTNPADFAARGILIT